ncbi:MAG: glutamine--tRNA ligase/YqeY domain fusion protein [Oscillospiraceae bacterium]|nr:glutamine--tRNA ligase/YqeY domain fusion protein [Oscillospiraceae bacterium]
MSNFLYDIIEKDIADGRYTEVRTRFPPEPNGCLHIGSAKAILINYFAKIKFGGTFNLRFDDTNPEKEDDEFARSIQEDIEWLIGEAPDNVFYGSDYFEICYDYALKLIKDGKAFVCDLSPDEMKEYNGDYTRPGKDSPYKTRSAEENLELFERMKNGEFPEKSKTLRAKIDMSSSNMNMRDPVIYRILYTPHYRQGKKWCVYPLYDYAHPLQDAIEGITHSMCSIEFENKRPLYDWCRDNVGIEEAKKPHQYEFARINMTYTTLSKRYLIKIVESGITDGWDDPRMPTLMGLRRRGFTPSAIREFIVRAGVSKVYNIVDIRLLEFCQRNELNKSARRRIAVLEPLPVVITNYPENKTEYFEALNNPEDESAGMRQIEFSKYLFIDRSDFEEVPPPKFFRLKPGGEVRLMGAYIIKCDEVIKNADGSITELHCSIDPGTGGKNPADGRKVKGTIHWLSKNNADKTNITLYDYLFTQEDMTDIPEGKNYADYLNPQSKIEYKDCLLEKGVGDTAGSNERFQFVRMGYFIKDSKNENTFNRIVTLKDGYKI